MLRDLPMGRRPIFLCAKNSQGGAAPESKLRDRLRLDARTAWDRNGVATVSAIAGVARNDLELMRVFSDTASGCSNLAVFSCPQADRDAIETP
jgi:hypothetical protein